MSQSANSLVALPKAVVWENRKLTLLDQRRLPHEQVHITCDSIDDVIECIRTLAVRGAPAIGIAAAYGLIVGIDEEIEQSDDFLAYLKKRAEKLIGARPTAVNLSWAVNRMIGTVDTEQSNLDLAARQSITEKLVSEAQAIHQEDIEACNSIADFGVSLVKKYPQVLTHCNAGSLAVSELGTALAPIYRAYEQGVQVHVFVDETRPLLQGARLTAWELSTTGVDCTLITDSMAAHVMASGQVDMVLVGTDRVAANGDVANKIGTMNLAILCQYFDIPFYVACPVSTIDLETPSGDQIEIEYRDASEVSSIRGQKVAPEGINVINPAFDVTPAKLVSGLITERGIVRAPYKENLRRLIEG